jgi:hypothetical protein
MDENRKELMTKRRQRILDAVELMIPDQVPLFLPFGLFSVNYAGLNLQDSFENPEKWFAAMEKAHIDFEPDMGFANVMITAPLKTLDIRVFKWPGYGVSPNSTHQFVEDEYMKAEEYEALLNDPTDFALRTFLPRTHGAMQGLNSLPPLMSLFFAYINLASIFSAKPIIESLEALVAAAKQHAQILSLLKTSYQRLIELGFPEFQAGHATSPFDVISDFLRGMRGSTLDMFRCPDKLLAAQQKLLPIILDTAINVPRKPDQTFVGIPLHRGSDEFMSHEQFEKFYWPGLKTLILSVIDAGLTPMIIWEGFWDSRLEYLKELPKGKIFGWFDRTDLFKAKEILGDTMCIAGGMPVSLLQSGTPDQIKDLTRRLIEVVGQDGGYIMSANTPIDDAKPELVRTWVDATRKYGVYKK